MLASQRDSATKNLSRRPTQICPELLPVRILNLTEKIHAMKDSQEGVRLIFFFSKAEADGGGADTCN